MEEEPIYTEGRYAVFAEQDEDCHNPYKYCDFEPPMMRYALSRFHGCIHRERDLYASEIIDMIKPEHCDTIEKRKALLDVFNWNGSYIDALRDIVNKYYIHNGITNTFRDWIVGLDFPEPSNWNCAQEFFDTLESICSIVGLSCIYEQSNGYSQGDCVLVFMVATPDWLKETGLAGCTDEELKASLMASYKQYSAWMWGDCYGWVIKKVVVDDDGDKSYVDTYESCWGYYTDDHDWSGLLEAGKDHLQYMIRQDEKEEAASFEAACRDIVTV